MAKFRPLDPRRPGHRLYIDAMGWAIAVAALSILIRYLT